MIIDFTFEGLGPFNEPVMLTFEASKDTHLCDSYVREIGLSNGKKIKLLRAAILYGANASGKTTVLEALSLLYRLVTSPFADSETEIDANFFAFDTAPVEQSAELSVKFVRAGTVYRYQVRLAKNSILCETLEYQATPPDGSKFVLIYQRSVGETSSQFNITYGPKQKLNKAEQEKLKAELLPNITMLSVLNRRMTIQNPMIEGAYLWFKEQLMGEVSSQINLASTGTQRYYNLMTSIRELVPEYNKVPHCKILPIDEIERSLHPDLLEHFLVVFLNDTSSNSQLIATTHYRELLQSPLLFRDDVIWFVHKDADSLPSQLYCLHDIQTRVGLTTIANVYDFYKHGRLGAVPKL